MSNKVTMKFDGRLPARVKRSVTNLILAHGWFTKWNDSATEFSIEVMEKDLAVAHGLLVNLRNILNAGDKVCSVSPLDVKLMPTKAGQNRPTEDPLPPLFAVKYTAKNRHMEVSVGNEKFELDFEDDDEWNCVTRANGDIWDVHLLIEENEPVEVSIYPVVNDSAQTDKPAKVVLYVEEK